MSKINKSLIVGFIIGAIIFVLNYSYFMLSGNELEFDSTMLINFGYNLYYSISLAAVNIYFFDYLNKIEWKELIKYRFFIGFFGSILLTMLTAILLRTIQAVIFDGVAFEVFISNEMDNGPYYLTVLLITIVIAIIFHAFYYYRELQKSKVKEQKIIAGTASAQFNALKNQLDPHFLFNSLNVLTSLIDENPDAAQKFTTSLSKVYRYVLEQKNKELIFVDEELKFAKTYIKLLKMRFEDSIIFEIPEKASNPNAKVVPLSLQLLLENAVKHNIVNAAKPLKIKIYESGGNLIVENNLQSKKVLKKGSGVGLVNIQQRYSLLTKRKVTINKTTSTFTVELPMLTKQATIMRTQSSNTVNSSYVRARKRVEKLKEFYGSLAAYVIVMPFLIFINMRTSSGFYWFWFPLFGWGMGLAFQAFEVFGKDKYFGKSWEDKKMQEFMEQDSDENNRWE